MRLSCPPERRSVDGADRGGGKLGARRSRRQRCNAEDSERAGEDRGMRNETPYATQPATARGEHGASEASDENHAPAGAQCRP